MSPSDGEAFHAAMEQVEAGHAQQAEPALRALATRYPANDQLSEALGLIYAERGEIARALPYLERASNYAPQSALDHANLGTAWLKLNRPHEAASELQLAAELDARNAGTLSNLGQADMLLGDAAGAARAFAQATNLDPHNSDLMYNWAVALNQNGETEQAAQALDRIPEAEKSDQAESLDGDVEEKLGHYLLAEQHYERAAQKNGSEANLYALCAELLRHWTWNQASKVAAYAVSKYPHSARLKMAYGVSLYGSKSFAEAARIFAELLEEDADNGNYAEMLGRTCGELPGGNRNCDALEVFAAKHRENAPADLYAAREILERQHGARNLERAQLLLESASRMKPAMAEVWYELGLIAEERKLWPESAQMLAKATGLRPAFAPAHYQLAQVDEHLGRAEDRRKELVLFQACSQKEQDDVKAKVEEMTVFLSAGALVAHE
jgi:predicted Zn-dependent protease